MDGSISGRITGAHSSKAEATLAPRIDNPSESCRRLGPCTHRPAIAIFI